MYKSLHINNKIKGTKLSNFLVKSAGNFFCKRIQIINNNRKYGTRTNFNFENLYNFFKGIYCWSLSPVEPVRSLSIDKNSLKTYPGHVTLLTDFFFKCYPEWSFSSLNQTCKFFKFLPLYFL